MDFEQEITQQMSDIADSVQGFENRFNERIDQRLNRQIEKLHAPVLGGRGDSEEDRAGFESLGEFLELVRFNKTDSRVREMESRALSTGDGSAGGYLVPPTFSDQILRIPREEAILRPLATKLPVGAGSPDAPISIPALDQSGSGGLCAGVEVKWLAEGGAKSATQPKFTLVTLVPNELAAYITVSDRLLSNAAGVSNLLAGLLGQAIGEEEQYQFFTGTGAGRPLGLVGCNAEITITRSVSSEVNYIDLVNMEARAITSMGPLVWVISTSVLSQLRTLTDGSGALIWTGIGNNANVGMPSTLLGKQLYVYDGLPALGSKADVILVAPRAYLIRDGAGLKVDASNGPNFLNNQTIIRASFTVDGKPWLNEPLTLRNGTTTLSPYVTLE